MKTDEELKEEIDKEFSHLSETQRKAIFESRWAILNDQNQYKPIRVYMCKTPGMQLWVSLSLTTWHLWGKKEKRPLPNLPIPFEVTNCRCKYCRWARIFRGY